MRKTLVIRGVVEKDGGNEKWNETRQVGIDALIAACQMDGKYLNNGIERIHRGKLRGDNDRKKGKRDIFALCNDWRVAQDILDNFHKNGRKSGLYVDQMYGPDTSFRRNLALQRRKELLGMKEIAHGYVDYPARLMVRYSTDEKRYTLHENFSATPIPLEQYTVVVKAH